MDDYSGGMLACRYTEESLCKGQVSLKSKDRAVATLLQSVASVKGQITLALAIVTCEVSGWSPDLGECLLDAMHVVLEICHRIMHLGLIHVHMA